MLLVNIFLAQRQEIGGDGVQNLLRGHGVPNKPKSLKTIPAVVLDSPQVWLPPETFSATPVVALSPLPPPSSTPSPGMSSPLPPPFSSSPSPAPPMSLPPSHLDCSLPGTAATSPTIERRFDLRLYQCFTFMKNPEEYMANNIQDLSPLPPLHQHRLSSSVSLPTLPVQVKRKRYSFANAKTIKHSNVQVKRKVNVDYEWLPNSIFYNAGAPL